MWGLFESWFEPARPSQTYGRLDYVLIVLILVAGTWLRFWHLGNVGLHGDEDIMGLATRALLEQGTPILPSGMEYTRALAHTYLLAGSTMIFGDNEWALRLPSAIIGSFCGLLAFFMGKRFLEPKLNIAFVAVLTFVPAMIDVSLTARMYVFYLAGLMLFAILLFRWEISGSLLTLAAAFLAWLLALHFHPLSVFAVPLFLFPALANSSQRLFLQGLVALVSSATIGIYLLLFADSNYPEESERLEILEEASANPLLTLFNGYRGLAIVLAILLGAATLTVCLVRNSRWRSIIPAAVLIAIGVAAFVLLHYHIGVIASLFGAILWLRADKHSRLRLICIGAGIGFVALTQIYVLYSSGEFPGRSIVGAFVGAPSIWPTLRFMTFSPIAVVIFVAGLALALLRLNRNAKIPVYFLFFAMAVWAPLMAIGFFSWNVAPRYTLGMLPFLLLCAFAVLPYLGKAYPITSPVWKSRAISTVVIVALIAAIINPVAALEAARNDYREHPDHKGAAEFIRNLGMRSNDVLIAEDSIIQTYYLGEIDYRLQSRIGASRHAVLREGVLYDQYTGAPVLGSGDELKRILDCGKAGDTYIIGSAQVSSRTQQRNRGNGIAEVLNSSRLEIVFVGQDKETTVWKGRQTITK